jgi:hypothetical protein
MHKNLLAECGIFKANVQASKVTCYPKIFPLDTNSLAIWPPGTS